MQQSDIDAKERLQVIDNTTKRAEELVKYLEDNLRSIQASGVVDVTQVKTVLDKTVSDFQGLFADFQAEKARTEERFTLANDRFVDHASRIGTLETKVASLEAKLSTPAPAATV